MADERPDVFGERLREQFLSRRERMLPPLSPKERTEREQRAARDREQREVAAIERAANELLEEFKRS